MDNRWDNNHHNNKVDDTIFARSKFHQFCEESQQSMREIQQGIATLLARKSSHNNNDQYIHWRTPNYEKIPFFDGEMCKLDFIDWLLDLEEYFNFWKIVMKKKYGLHVIIKLDNEADKWWEDTQIDRKRQGKHPIHSW